MAVIRKLFAVLKVQIPILRVPLLVIAAAIVYVVCAATSLPRNAWVWLVVLLLWASLAMTRAEARNLSGATYMLELRTRGSLAAAALRFIVVLSVGSLTWGHLSESAVALCALMIVVLLLPARIVTLRLEEQLTASVFARGFGDETLEGVNARGLLRAIATGWPLVIPQAILIAVLLLPDNSLLVWVTAIVSLIVAVFITGYTLFLSKTEGTAIRRDRIVRLEKALGEYAPTVALYSCAGRVLNLFWVTMWVPVVADLDQRSVVIVRSQSQFDALVDCPVPVISIGRTSDMLDMDFGTIRGALYVSNTGMAIHLLKHRNIMSAFIGHGDSDKQSSTNPFAKVYDEIWVAGEAGADRFRRAEVGVHEDQFVYVGRPTLDTIETSAQPLPADSGSASGAETDRGSGRGEVPKTVLYAPTWEGWDGGQEYTSVHQGGVKMIRSLVKADPPVRIVYKAHPYAGQRLRSVTAANKKIQAILRQANEGISDPSKKHIIARHGDKHLYEWFNEADFLVTDITGVLSDFVASEKPYAVFNFTAEDPVDFVREYPTASAGLIYNSSADSLARLVDYIEDPATYTDDQARRELRSYLLGDPAVPASEKFQAAVSDLLSKSEARVQARTGQ